MAGALFAELSNENIALIAGAIIAVAKIVEKVWDAWQLRSLAKKKRKEDEEAAVLKKKQDEEAARQIAVKVEQVAQVAVATADAVKDVKKVAAENAEQVKTALAETNTATSDKLSVIHTLVNSGFGQLLADKAALTRREAIRTGNVDDVAIADAAEKASADHIEKQAEVDRSKTGGDSAGS
jgi:DNA anti-recombination protein RmuC